MFTLRNIGIHASHENTLYIREDSPLTHSEGFKVLTRVFVCFKEASIIATLNTVHSNLLQEGEAALSEEAMERLNVQEGDCITVKHLQPVASLSHVRAKIYGKELSETAYREIISDVVDGLYSNIELAAFVTACAGDNMNLNEIVGLTKAMIECGQQIKWEQPVIYDKHCVGGIPGNRTTPIVVSIAAAAGLIIPKTSSKAITSPAGTADMMETITKVNLSIEEIKEVVRKENACLAWGGGVKLSPADDLLIYIEKALEIDSEAQMVASVLSKKAAAGSTHVVIDIPFGKTAKVRSHEEALKLKYYFEAVGEAIHLNISVLITDGAQPVGRGIGPALEALDVLSILKNQTDAPQDLRLRACMIAGKLLEIAGKCASGDGIKMADSILESGAAYHKFRAICEAQGEFKTPQPGAFSFDVIAEQDGTVKEIDNRKLARIAKLAGAPKSYGAGIVFNAPVGKSVSKGDLLYTIYAEGKGQLEYVIEYLKTVNHLILFE
jgi:thymidine phosphorylase